MPIYICNRLEYIGKLTYILMLVNIQDYWTYLAFCLIIRENCYNYRSIPYFSLLTGLQLAYRYAITGLISPISGLF